ncbi:MAG: hypoxanthine phosphoribosyltransferase [Clostridiales bacterium]|nr:hypoxanthine phosphoribosyltransferase [Clostridiales bacterium]
MNKDIQRILFSESQIKEKVVQAAAWLDRRYAGKNPLFISVLKGSVMFFCDLVRAMETPVQMDFMMVSSYGSGTESSGIPKIVMDLAEDVTGRDVVLVEDIVDSGHTLQRMQSLMAGRGAASFTTVALFDKPVRRKVDVKADYSCFEVGDEFIVGYGLDYAQQYRNLPYVGILKREVYEKNKTDALGIALCPPRL